MIFRPYYYDLGCAAYVFGCGTVGTGAVVDARGDDIDSYIDFANAKGLRLTHVIDTHVQRRPPVWRSRHGASPARMRRHYMAACTSGSVCGAGVSGKSMTTIGFEKRWNPMLSLERDIFVDRLADVPPKPADMERVITFTRGHETVTMK